MAKEHIIDSGMEDLFAAILSLNNEEECRAFFLDLCTISELKSMAQRLQVAKLLQQDLTYTEITEETGVSAATISRVSKALEYGEDGYQLILRRLAANQTDDSEN